MSSNNLNSNKPYTTYLKFDGKLDVHGLNRLNEDNCEKTFATKQSESPGIYQLSQYKSPNCGVPEVIKVAVENPEIQFKDGYGISDCYIDDNTKLRVGKTKKLINEKILLFNINFVFISISCFFRRNFFIIKKK